MFASFLARCSLTMGDAGAAAAVNARSDVAVMIARVLITEDRLGTPVRRTTHRSVKAMEVHRFG